MASPKPQDPRRLDVLSFAKDRQALSGQWAVADLPRLHQEHVPSLAESQEGGAAPVVSWTLQGQWHEVVGRDPVIGLNIQAQVTLNMTCQRCLNPVPQDVAVDRLIRFVRGEEAAAALDEELEDDVLALLPKMDIQELIEDECIMALPLIAKHPACELPIVKQSTTQIDEAIVPEKKNPFEVLRQLHLQQGKDSKKK